MSQEPEFQAHCRCWWCNAVRPRKEIIFCDDKPICRDGDCRDEYYNRTKPAPRSRGYYDKG